MNVIADLTAGHLAYWADEYRAAQITMRAPAGMAGCSDCTAIVTRSSADDPPVIRVAWKPDEIDLAHLARGGTIWLSTWGALPPHSLEVQAPTFLEIEDRVQG